MTGLPAWVDDLAARARRSDGHPPFSDRALVDARSGARQVLAVDEVAAAIVSDAEAELVVDPDARRRGHGTALLAEVVARSHAGLLIWAHGEHPAAAALAARFGFEPVRRLLKLRADVPSRPTGGAPSGSPSGSSSGEAAPSGSSSGEAAPSGSSSGEAAYRDPDPAQPGFDTALRAYSTRDTALRAYSTRDTALREYSIRGWDAGARDAWLALNARTFATHPEQGSVSASDLDALVSESWFDADDFLLAFDGDDLVGYDWLKVEGDVAEIYVLGVDPDRRGSGLGAVLLEAGFDRMRERGIRTAELYVESDNAAALALYAKAGFTQESVDVQYRLSDSHGVHRPGGIIA